MTGRTGDPDDHVSVIIRDMCIRLGHFEGPDANDTRDPQTIFAMGNSFEDAIALALAERWAKQYPNRYVRPGEFELDGLLGTPDLLDLVNQRIVEMKLTWLSARQEPEGEKFWKYWTQTLAYCKMVGYTEIELHVCHINGYYKRDMPGPDPQYRIYIARPTQLDIDKNWVMLQRHHASMKRKRYVN